MPFRRRHGWSDVPDAMAELSSKAIKFVNQVKSRVRDG